jgi:hypothetical protein
MIEIIGWNEKCVQNALKLRSSTCFNRFCVPAGRFNASRQGYHDLVQCYLLLKERGKCDILYTAKLRPARSKVGLWAIFERCQEILTRQPDSTLMDTAIWRAWPTLACQIVDV